MMLDVAQSMSLLIIAILAVIILLRVLVIVHKQAKRVKELEAQMKAMDAIESTTLKSTDTEKEDE